MSATLRQLVDGSLNVLGEVAGVGVQQFTEDRIFDDVVRGFDLLFKKYPWPNYVDWFRIELDGTIGIPTTDAFGQVRDFEDFLGVYRDGESAPLSTLPTNLNRYTITGTRVQYWTSLPATHANYAARKIRVYPEASEGFLNVGAKVYPLTLVQEGFDWQDVLYIDKQLLEYAGAYMTLVGNDLNPNAASTVKQFMEGRYADIIAALSNHPISIRGRRGVPDEWFVRR